MKEATSLRPREFDLWETRPGKREIVPPDGFGDLDSMLAYASATENVPSSLSASCAMPIIDEIRVRSYLEQVREGPLARLIKGKP